MFFHQSYLSSWYISYAEMISAKSCFSLWLLDVDLKIQYNIFKKLQNAKYMEVIFRASCISVLLYLSCNVRQGYQCERRLESEQIFIRNESGNLKENVTLRFWSKLLIFAKDFLKLQGDLKPISRKKSTCAENIIIESQFLPVLAESIFKAFIIQGYFNIFFTWEL